MVLLSAALPAHAVVLRYQPAVGSVQKQKATMAGRMETSMEGLGQMMRMELVSEMNYQQKALSQTDEVTRVETKLLGGKASVKFGEQSQSIDMPDGKIVADIDRRGRMAKLVEMDMKGQQSQQMMGADSLGNWSQFAAFPEGEVTVGDSWADKITVPSTAGGPDLTLDLNSKLLSVETFQGRQCAKIRTTFSGPMEYDLSAMGQAGAMNATLQGDMVWYYDYENSVYVYGEGTVGMDMNMASDASGMPAGAMTSKMIMNVKLAMVK
jgi:hypothetical protein